MNISIQKLHPDAILPQYGSADAAGADLCSVEEITIAPGETKLVHTGLAMAIPQGFGGFIFARSGLATKRGLAPANKVGVVDADYRGEVMVALYNQGSTEQTILKGERIAQMVFLPCPQATLELCDSLEETERGNGGFGSTGRK